MKAVLAYFSFEANHFSPYRTDLDFFKEKGWYEGQEQVRPFLKGIQLEIRSCLEILEKEGWAVDPVFVCSCGGVAGGVITREAFQVIRETMKKQLAAALPADAIVLLLHGASCAEGEEDPEGNLLEMVRTELKFKGRLILSLDMHANVTRRMLKYPDAITSYQTMPHVDLLETGVRAAKLTMKDGPWTRAMAKIKALIPPTDTDHRVGRFSEMLKWAREAERDSDIEEVCLMPVQPWMDIGEMGTSVVVTGKGRAPARVAKELGERWYAQRHDWQTGILSWKTILGRLQTHAEKTWYLADTADAIPGGSPGESSKLLEMLLPVADKLAGPVLLHMVDSEGVKAARHGKTHFRLGRPAVEFDAKVVRVGDGAYVGRGGGYKGTRFRMGGAAVLQRGHLFIVVATLRTGGMDPALYECMGLDPDHAHGVHVHTLMGWRTAYGATDDQAMNFDGPGATRLVFSEMPYTGERRGLFPIDPEPRNPIEIFEA